MSIAISSAVSIQPTEFTNSSSNAPAPTAQQAQPATEQPVDTVKLSESQQVHQLFNQGLRVTQIAFNLRLTVQAVNSYLGIISKTG